MILASNAFIALLIRASLFTLRKVGISHFDCVGLVDFESFRRVAKRFKMTGLKSQKVATLICQKRCQFFNKSKKQGENFKKKP